MKKILIGWIGRPAFLVASCLLLAFGIKSVGKTDDLSGGRVVLVGKNPNRNKAFENLSAETLPSGDHSTAKPRMADTGKPLYFQTSKSGRFSYSLVFWENLDPDKDLTGYLARLMDVMTSLKAGFEPASALRLLMADNISGDHRIVGSVVIQALDGNELNLNKIMVEIKSSDPSSVFGALDDYERVTGPNNERTSELLSYTPFRFGVNGDQFITGGAGNLMVKKIVLVAGFEQWAVWQNPDKTIRPATAAEIASFLSGGLSITYNYSVGNRDWECPRSIFTENNGLKIRRAGGGAELVPRISGWYKIKSFPGLINPGEEVTSISGYIGTGNGLPVPTTGKSQYFTVDWN